MEEPGQGTKKINDSAQLQQIAAKVFTRGSVSLVEKSGEKPVRVKGFQNAQLIIEHDQPESPVRVLTTIQSERRMLLECQVMARSGTEERVRPVRLHLSRQIRTEARIEVPEQETSKVWISNCLPLAMIPESLGAADAKRDAVISAFTAELKKRYAQSAIVVRRSMRSDSRMRAITQFERPIFYSQSQRSKGAAGFLPVEEYEKIRKYDTISKSLQSEICEPLWYRGVLLLGYVQSLSESDLTEGDYSDLRQFARGFEQNLNPFLPKSNDRCPVVDIHHTGVGFLHPHNTQVLKSFFSGAEVILDLNFGDGSHFTCFAVVRNVKSRERTHRIGAELHPLKPAQTEILERHLRQLAASQPPQAAQRPSEHGIEVIPPG